MLGDGPQTICPGDTYYFGIAPFDRMAVLAAAFASSGKVAALAVTGILTTIGVRAILVHQGHYAT